MTKQVLKINNDGFHYICIHDDKQKYNPYMIYKVWYDNGPHRKKVNAYADFGSVLHFLTTLHNIKEIAR